MKTEYDLKHLEKLVLAWAKDRNIIEGSTTQHQFMKLDEEFGELSDAVLLSHMPGIEDGIGDFAVVLINIAAQLGIKGGLSRCLLMSVADPSLSKGLFELIIRMSSEKGRLASAIARGRKYKAMVHIGNCLVLARAVARTANLGSLEDCLAAAYEEIKDREGEMVENVWVKKADLGRVWK